MSLIHFLTLSDLRIFAYHLDMMVPFGLGKELQVYMTFTSELSKITYCLLVSRLRKVNMEVSLILKHFSSIHSPH